MTALVFIKDLLVATFSQMASLLAGVVIFGLLIHFISHLTFKSLERSFGSAGTYLVSWLGTPIHELSHAIFCIIFLHRIVEIKFFSPDPVTGTLGYVHHKWNKYNPWQMLGNFFIGIGPVIFGCAALFALFYFLIPGSSRAWDDITTRVAEIDGANSIGDYLAVLQGSALVMVRLIFTASNLASWQFWVFLYLAICVASNIRLSWADLKIALSGLGCVVLPFLLINLVGLLTGSGTDRFFPATASSLGIVYSILILALFTAVIGFILVYLLSAAWYRMRYRSTLNPF
jgi:hypothetical protein